MTVTVDPLLSLRHVSFRYPSAKQPIFSDLDFDVSAGEVVAFVGDSGMGKTTLLRLLAHLYEPTTGVFVKRGSTRGGFVFQQPVLVEWLSAEKNVVFPDRLVDSTVVQSILRDVGLEHAAASFPKQMSGGMRSRLQLARALYRRPDCLFLDEVFSQIQEQLRIELAMLFKTLRFKYGFSAIISTHHLEDAVFLADRIFVVARRNVGPRRVQEFQQQKRFSRANREEISSTEFQEEVENLRKTIWDLGIEQGAAYASE